MIQLLSLEHLAGVLHWGRLTGSWGPAECARLRRLVGNLPLQPGASDTALPQALRLLSHSKPARGPRSVNLEPPLPSRA